MHLSCENIQHNVCKPTWIHIFNKCRNFTNSFLWEFNKILKDAYLGSWIKNTGKTLSEQKIQMRIKKQSR